MVVQLLCRLVVPDSDLCEGLHTGGVLLGYLLDGAVFNVRLVQCCDVGLVVQRELSLSVVVVPGDVAVGTGMRNCKSQLLNDIDDNIVELRWCTYTLESRNVLRNRTAQHGHECHMC